MRIGYFHGGRSVLLYRTYVFGFFTNVPVELHTRWLNDPTMFKVPQKFEAAEELRASGKRFGKIDGMEIIQKMLAGELDGGTAGESSFLYYASRGAPIVAVAMLGHDVAGDAGRGIVFRKEIVIRSPEDLKGKTLVTRRSGPGEAIFLREFLESMGMANEPSIQIIDDLDEDVVSRWLREGKVDGGLYHVWQMSRFIDKNRAVYLYRPMDWMNPELSHALLVFRKDVVRDRPEAIRKIVHAYIRRIQSERKLPIETQHGRRKKTLVADGSVEGMSTPQYDLPPRVRLDLLEEMQRLLMKYKYATNKVDLRKYIDNQFVEEP